MMQAIDAGAEDFADEEDCYEVTTAPSDFEVVRKALEDAGIPMASAEVTMVPQNYVTLTDDADIVNLHNWSLGSFSGINWDNVKVMAIVVLITMFFVFLLSKPISAYQMGEAYAQNMGLNVSRFRIVLVILSSILSACVTAFAGPVSFVGIAVPHLVKGLFGTTQPILMIPACFLGGASFCLFCDLLARTLLAPTELSISTVTAIFGAPVVIWVMVKRKKERAV